MKKPNRKKRKSQTILQKQLLKDFKKLQTQKPKTQKRKSLKKELLKDFRRLFEPQIRVERLVRKKVRIKTKEIIIRKYKGRSFKRRKLKLQAVRQVKISGINRIIKGENEIEDSRKFLRSLAKSIDKAKSKIKTRSKKYTIGATYIMKSKKGKEFTINSFLPRDLMLKNMTSAALISVIAANVAKYAVRTDLAEIELESLTVEV